MTRYLSDSLKVLALCLPLLACLGDAAAQPMGQYQGQYQGQPQAQLVQGRHFTFVLPPGWRVGEEGNHALVLQAPDLSAGVIIYGVSGFAQNLSPAQFASSAITNYLRLAPNVSISNPAPIQPISQPQQEGIVDSRDHVCLLGLQACIMPASSLRQRSSLPSGSYRSIRLLSGAYVQQCPCASSLSALSISSRSIWQIGQSQSP